MVAFLVAAVAAAAPIQPLVVPAHVQKGRAMVPYRCEIARCVGTAVSGKDRVKLRLKRRQRGLMTFPVSSGVPTLRLTIRLKRKPASRIAIALTRRRDRRACGYGPLATMLQRVGDTRLLRIDPDEFDDFDDDDLSTLLVCRRGKPVARIEEATYFGGSDTAVVTSLSTRWAGAITIFSDDRQGVELLDVIACRLRDGRGFLRRIGLNGGPFPEIVPKALAISDRGAVAVGQLSGEEPQVRVLDGAGERVVDSGPGVDPVGLRTGGGLVRWTRDGLPQSAPIGAAPWTAYEQGTC